MKAILHFRNTRRESGLFKGEWIVILLIFIITGVTAFFYTTAQLNEKQREEAASDTTYASSTPTPTVTPGKGQVR